MSSPSSVIQATVTLRVHRFTPRPERERRHSSSPFGRRGGSPFADSARAGRPRGKSWVQEYELLVRPEDTLLDCLLTIKRDIDPTLAFRYSCGHGMCGSDAVAVNGTPTLLCTAQVQDWVQRLPNISYPDDEGFRRTGDVDDADNANVFEEDLAHQIDEGDHLGVIELAALPGFPVKRDLVADIDSMLEQIRRLKPYLIHHNAIKTREDGKVDVLEYLQNPQELAKYELLSNCIACGVCEGRARSMPAARRSSARRRSSIRRDSSTIRVTLQPRNALRPLTPPMACRPASRCGHALGSAPAALTWARRSGNSLRR